MITELLEYLHIIKKRLWIILLVTIIAALCAGLYSKFMMTPVYEAKSSLIIGKTPNSETDKVQYNDILMYQKLVKTYGELAKSRVVADETIKRLNLDMTPEKLQEMLTVTPMSDTQILEISIQDKNPSMAAQLANTLSQVFVEKVSSMMNTEDVKIMDEAQVPKNPVSPRTSLNIIIAGFLGLMASLGVIFLIEYLDNTIKTEEDVEKYLGLTVLASIPFTKENKA